METDEELSELHNLYSDWRNRVAHFAAQPITGCVLTFSYWIMLVRLVSYWQLVCY